VPTSIGTSSKIYIYAVIVVVEHVPMEVGRWARDDFTAHGYARFAGSAAAGKGSETP
jgi:hypothetical protein